jgi:hypothetical protein
MPYIVLILYLKVPAV